MCILSLLGEEADELLTNVGTPPHKVALSGRMDSVAHVRTPEVVACFDALIHRIVVPEVDDVELVAPLLVECMALSDHFLIDSSVLAAGEGHLILELSTGDDYNRNAPSVANVSGDALEGANGSGLVEIFDFPLALKGSAGRGLTLGVVGGELYAYEVDIGIGGSVMQLESGEVRVGSIVHIAFTEYGVVDVSEQGAALGFLGGNSAEDSIGKLSLAVLGSEYGGAEPENLLALYGRVGIELLINSMILFVVAFALEAGYTCDLIEGTECYYHEECEEEDENALENLFNKLLGGSLLYRLSGGLYLLTSGNGLALGYCFKSFDNYGCPVCITLLGGMDLVVHAGELLAFLLVELDIVPEVDNLNAPLLGDLIESIYHSSVCGRSVLRIGVEYYGAIVPGFLGVSDNIFDSAADSLGIERSDVLGIRDRSEGLLLGCVVGGELANEDIAGSVLVDGAKSCDIILLAGLYESGAAYSFLNVAVAGDVSAHVYKGARLRSHALGNRGAEEDDVLAVKYGFLLFDNAIFLEVAKVKETEKLCYKDDSYDGSYQSAPLSTEENQTGCHVLLSYLRTKADSI